MCSHGGPAPTLTSGLISIGFSCIFADHRINHNPKKPKNSRWSRPGCTYKAPAGRTGEAGAGETGAEPRRRRRSISLESPHAQAQSGTVDPPNLAVSLAGEIIWWLWRWFLLVGVTWTHGAAFLMELLIRGEISGNPSFTVSITSKFEGL